MTAILICWVAGSAFFLLFIYGATRMPKGRI